MKLKLDKTPLGDGNAIYFTNLFGRRITLSRALTQALKTSKRMAREVTFADDELLLTSQEVEKGGKHYTNFYLTVTKKQEKLAEKKQEKEEDLPF